MNTPVNPPTDRRDGERRGSGRRLAAVGLTAGLLGGGAIGLVATMPSVTSAATDDAAAVGLQADADETSEETGRPDRGERLREALQALVDDGTLTAAQADAVAAHLDEQAPERAGRRHGEHGERGEHGEHGHRGHGLPGAGGDVVADVIGIDAETLREELRSGSSIADIAEANGVDPQVVVDALVGAAEDHLDLMVENGRLTEEEAAERLEQLDARIAARVNGERPEID